MAVNPEDSEDQDKKDEDKDEGNTDVRHERVTVVSLKNKTLYCWQGLQVNRLLPGKIK